MITSSKNARHPSNLFVAFTLAISFCERERERERGKLGERTDGEWCLKFDILFGEEKD